jgi:hypothetical protein
VGKFAPTEKTYLDAKRFDSMGTSPNLSKCGVTSPEIVSLSSNAGRCAQGSVVVFWAYNSRTMACCQLEEPSLLLNQAYIVRSKECLRDEVVVGFDDHANRRVKCGKIDASRVRVSDGVQLPAAVGTSGLGGSFLSIVTSLSPATYPAGRNMLAAFGGSAALGCRDEYMIQGLADTITGAILGLPDVLPRCRKLESVLKK